MSTDVLRIGSRTCRKCGTVNDASTGDSFEACPRCGVVYAKYGVPVRAKASTPVRAPPIEARIVRRNHAVMTHAGVAAAALVVGFYVGQLAMQAKVADAIARLGVDRGVALHPPPASAAPPVSAPAPPAARAELAGVVTVRLLRKGFRDKDFSGPSYVTDAITFAVEFTNRGDKGIRAFDGGLTFTDLLDNRILGAKVSISDPIAAGGTVIWEGQLDYNQFMDSHERLRSQELADLKLTFKPGKLLFDDGSRSDAP